MKMLLALSAVLFSCSVKEDRTDCPCDVELKVIGGQEAHSLLMIWDSSLTVRDTLWRRDSISSFFIRIPKGFPVLTLCDGQRETQTRGSSLTVSNGHQMDEIYAWTGRLDTRCEAISVTARLHKQFSYIHLNVRVQNGEASPYLVRLKSDVCGLDLTTLQPVEGPFEVSFLPVIGSYHRICVPRQTDTRMMLEFQPRESFESYEAFSFPLGEYLDKSGFDWTAEDLDDIYLEIDYARAGVSVSVADWQEGDSISITI